MSPQNPSRPAPTLPSADPDEVEQRAVTLLALGSSLLDGLGRVDDSESADALRELEILSDRSAELMDVNQRLVPLMHNLRRPGRGSSWKRWFTGELLEQDVFFHQARHQIETLAELGRRSHPALKRQAEQLKRLHDLMGTEIRCLTLDLDAARLLLKPFWRARCEAAGLDADDMARLERRVAHLESLLTATQLTRAQFQVAVRHARDVGDRYREIRTLLLPVWKQAVGFDLYARHTEAAASASLKESHV